MNLTTSNIEDLLYAMQQNNLVYNHNFLYYSNRTLDTQIVYNHPDGWVYKDKGTNGQISFDPESNSCVLIKSNGDDLMTFRQTINEFPRWRDTILGKTISARILMEVPGTSDCEITFSLYDGVDTSSKSVLFKSGEKKEMNVSLDISKNATTLVISVESSTNNGVIYIKEVCANLGNVALYNLPCVVQGVIGERKQYISTDIPPAEELSLCNPSEELSDSYTRLNSYLNGKFGLGSKNNSLLPDMRGYFSRAWDNGAAVDTDADQRTSLGTGTVKGDNVGTVEQDMFKEHEHELSFDLSGQISSGPLVAMPSINKALTSKTQKTGGKETRAKNIAELYSMKWA